VAEELTLGEAFGHRRAVEGDERTPSSVTDGMDRPRDELFAGAALAVDANVGVTFCGLLDPAEDVEDLLGPPDESVKGGRARGAASLGHEADE
jgi:hypothetical protein